MSKRYSPIDKYKILVTAHIQATEEYMQIEPISSCYEKNRKIKKHHPYSIKAIQKMRMSRSLRNRSK